MDAIDESARVATGADKCSSGLAQFAALLKSQWLRCLLLVLVGIGARAPALQGPLIWDDVYLARDNPFIKSPLLILEAFRHYLFPDSYSGHYRPVQTISYIFDYLIWNTDTYGYHLSNVLWHVGSGILLYFLLQEILGSLSGRCLDENQGRTPADRSAVLSRAAFVLALLWMVHPVHSAAVDYISGRADSLAFFFACGGWLLYLRAREMSRSLLRRVLYGVAVLSALLALCSRESGCIWMLVFLLYLSAFDRKATLQTKLLVLAVCLSVVAVYAGLRYLPESRPENTSPASWTSPTRAVLMLRALGDYGRLMVFPTKLHLERNVLDLANYRSQASWRDSIAVEYLSIAGAVLLAAFVFGASRRGAGQRARIFGATWFFLAYLPISNLFDLNATVAEHWLYLPSVGFLIFLAGCVIELPIRFRRGAMGIAGIAVLGLSVRSAIRSNDWVDPETFFRRTFAAGGSSSRIGVNLAVIYSKQGEHAKAETILRKVLQLTPDYPLARINLAIALSHQGKTKEAEDMFDSASKTAPEDRNMYPRTWEAALHLAHLRHKEKDDKTALAVLEKARADYPGTWDLVSFEAEVLRESQGPNAALGLVQDFAQGRWWHARASLALGRIYWEKGDATRAEAAFRHASWLDVHDVDALNLIAMMRVRQNRLEDAFQAQRRAVARQPDEPRQYVMLSNILEKMGRTEEARAAIAQVTRLRALAQSQPIAN
jgi:tetratricopeptide (TPR) repeat protein